MRRALYDPRNGYYARRISGIGRRGDFTTVPVMTPALGRAIAGWLVRARRETGIRHVIEAGPGEGSLAESVRRHLPWADRWRTRFHLVEISAPLRAKQQARLGRAASWHDSMEEALAACEGEALMYSNELVDAFPVRKFRLGADGWRECGVRRRIDGPPEEVLLPEAELPDGSALHGDFPVGQSVEVHDSYRRWQQGWMSSWKSGRMLTIDYGDTVSMLYQRRPGGTLRGYWFQQAVQGAELLLREGHQDLTADVNFTDLMRWGEVWSSSQQLRSLREFCGEDAPAWLKTPQGVGEAFLVLEQRCR